MKVRPFSSLLLARTGADLVFIAALRERCSGHFERFHSLLSATVFVFPGVLLPKVINVPDTGQPRNLGEASRDTSSGFLSGYDILLI